MAKHTLALASVAFCVATLTPCTEVPAQSTSPWVAIGWSSFADVTGRRDSTLKSVRADGADTFTLRSEYRSDRHTSDGKSWRTSYSTLMVDCGRRSIAWVRIDYVSAAGERVTETAPGVVVGEKEIRLFPDFVYVFNEACTIKPS